MKILLVGVNPNCSDLVIRTGMDPDDEKGIREEIKTILKYSKLKLRVIGIPHPVNPESIYIRSAGKREGSDRDVYDYALMVDGLVTGIESNSTIKINELEQMEGRVELYLPSHDSAIVLSDFGDDKRELVVFVGDYDHEYFPAMAELCHAMGYQWHTDDGGHGDSFQEWCRENGYDDVADMHW